MSVARRWSRIAAVVGVLATVAFVAPAAADASTVRAPAPDRAAVAGLGRPGPTAALPATAPLRTARASRGTDTALLPRVAAATRPTLVVPTDGPTAAGHRSTGSGTTPARGPPVRPSH